MCSHNSGILKSVDVNCFSKKKVLKLYISLPGVDELHVYILSVKNTIIGKMGNEAHMKQKYIFQGISLTSDLRLLIECKLLRSLSTINNTKIILKSCIKLVSKVPGIFLKYIFAVFFFLISLNIGFAPFSCLV